MEEGEDQDYITWKELWGKKHAQLLWEETAQLFQAQEGRSQLGTKYAPLACSEDVCSLENYSEQDKFIPCLFPSSVTRDQSPV